jgi:hypothetical protein
MGCCPLKRCALILPAFFLSAVLARGLLGQVPSGTLHCQVTDPSGAAVTNATVLVASAAGQTSAAQGSKDGGYEIKGLAPGKYTVKAVAQGFALYEQQGVTITAGHVQQLSISLQIEVQQEKVEVTGEAAQVSVSSENNASALVLQGKDLEALSDDPDELQSELEALAGPAAGPNGGQIYIDGFTAGQLPPKSSIREIRINQNLASSASMLPKSRSLLRQHRCSSASKLWASTAATISSSSGRQSAVVPKVPSRMPRPARPAIWAISGAVSRRGRWPSNLPRLAKATWSTSMFRPMPIASVATRKSTSLS